METADHSGQPGRHASGTCNDYQVYRAALLRFDAVPDSVDHCAHYDADGLLVTATDARGLRVIVAAGAWRDLAPVWSHLPVTDWSGCLIAPGFVDMHLHYPQIDMTGSPSRDLLTWLEDHTFPAEQRFSDVDHASEMATFFLSELRRHGITTALVFATSHAGSVNALFEAALPLGVRLITGKVLQDRHSPDGLRDGTAASLADSESLILRWHGVGRLGYALTPRFAPTSSAAQLPGAGEPARRYPDVWIQSHVAENRAEVAWAMSLFPGAASYLSIYAEAGLLRPRSVYAHCLHLLASDWDIIRQSGAAIAVCPTSNLFLGSGFFDYGQAMQTGCRYGLASDVGAGTTLNPFRTMLAAYCSARESQTKQGLTLSAQHLWWQHTAGAASALGLTGQSTLMPGSDADFIVLDPSVSPVLKRKNVLGQPTHTIDELLFALIVAGDDRLIKQVSVAGLPDHGAV